MKVEKSPRLAILVPCYNEEEVLASTNERLQVLLQEMVADGLVASDSYVMYGDDGSHDGTWHMIMDFKQTCHGTVEGLKLIANAGHQNVLLAMIEATADFCDISVSIDADLQDDPHAIIEMVKDYCAGFDVVMGVRNKRDCDTIFKRLTAKAYYHLISAMGVKSVFNHADFRLLSHRAMKALMGYGERNLYLRGLICSMGFRSTTVTYDRVERKAGETKYPLSKMLNLAVDGITSFSVKPVRMVAVTGMIFMLVALGILVYVLYSYSHGTAVPGWSSLMLSVWFCSGMILVGIGVVGEYIGKIYTEVKHRPRYTIECDTLKK